MYAVRHCIMPVGFMSLVKGTSDYAFAPPYGKELTS
jgi:hypothetical protein